MLGFAAMFIEGGSGADNTVNTTIIQKIKQSCTYPLIVGGGIQTPQCFTSIFEAGADIAVIGTI
jgi:putative glycerol-1-phosphate prenyltransferase